MRRFLFLVCVFVSLLALAPTLRADGGTVLTREKTGPFLVTLFATPAGPRSGPMDLSVMVQSSANNEAILDAEVELCMVPPPGAQLKKAATCCAAADGTQIADCVVNGEDQPRPIPATRRQATNKLLYAATVNVPVDGEWKLKIRVRQGQKTAELIHPLLIADGETSWGVAWPFVVVPVVVIGVFGWHQRLRRNRTDRTDKAEGGIPNLKFQI